MKYTRATVGAVITRGDEILLAKRGHEPFEGKWCIPGGHIEFGEHPVDAVKREVLEETGLTLEGCRFFNVYSEYYEHLQWHAVALIYEGNGSGLLIPQEGEVSELRYVPFDQALKFDLAFNHIDIIRDYVKKAEKGGELVN